MPVRIKIPVIYIDAAIEKVTVTSDGAMDVPKAPADAAWFSLGPRPGESGSAVIAGHYGWKNGVQAVFDNLYTLRKGDKVYVEDEKGVTTTFVVRELRRYGENEDASGVFVSNDGVSHLNLITCEGVWNKDTKSYSKRLVVFTDKDIE
ncbi:MAG: class F sortase [bacterium]|nr:class F sortase [bacterium]